MEHKPILETKALTRRYGKKVALDQLTFTVDTPGIWGLLGRNGAGKSTLLRIVTAQDFATEGEALVFGETPYENGKILKEICLIGDKPEYGSLRTIRDVLLVHRDIHPEWDADYAASLLERFELTDKLKVKALSRGMQTSLGLTCGLASCARFTIFDEPSLGLDAVMRERFYDMVLEDRQRRPERTIMLSTHLIEEVTRALMQVVMIDHGKLLLTGAAQEVTADAYTLKAAGEQTLEKLAGQTGAKLLRKETTVTGEATYYLRGPRPDSLPDGVDMAPINLQRLFVLLTDPAGGDKA